jgi:ribosomal protein S18 acetylase RimI-like enzyme
MKNSIATSNDSEMLSQTISKAMFADPMYKYLIMNQDQNYKYFQPFWKAIIEYTLKNGIVIKNDMNYGAMCLIKPNKTDFSFIDIIKTKCEIPIAIFKIPFSVRIKFANIVLKLGKYQNEIIPVPHYYLLCLGVLPNEQGKGIGKSLLKTMIEIVDQEKMPIYLETETEQNISLYEKYGFIDMKTQIIEKYKLGFHLMIRK